MSSDYFVEHNPPRQMRTAAKTDAVDDTIRRLTRLGAPSAARSTATRGVDPVSEARRVLTKTRSAAGAPTNGLDQVEAARRELARLQSATRGVDQVEAARRELARLQAEGSTRGLESAGKMPTRGIELDAEHRRMLKAMEDARRSLNEVSGRSTRGMKEDEEPEVRVCLNQKAALADLARVQAAGGIAKNVVTDSNGTRVLLVSGPTGNIERMPLHLVDKMLEHATAGCIPGDDLLQPCANCAEHM